MTARLKPIFTDPERGLAGLLARRAADAGSDASLTFRVKVDAAPPEDLTAHV